ncbi:unnamed protein product, partial [Cuscuta campestris]
SSLSSCPTILSSLPYPFSLSVGHPSRKKKGDSISIVELRKKKEK